MTTYARLVNGYALDCQIAASATELAARFHPAWLAANPFVVVPDGTLHGAKDMGGGVFQNPVPAAPATADLTLDRKELRTHVISVFGGNGPGTAKMQYYFDLANASTATTAAELNRRAALQAFRSDESFTKSEAQQLMAGLQFASGDSAAVLAAWPVRVIG